MLKLTGDERFTQTGFRHLQSTRAQVGHRRNRRNLNALRRHPFDVAQQPMFTRLGQRDRHPFATGASRATNAVHVRFGVYGYIIVHDMRYVLHIKSARGNVGRDQQIRLARAKFVHHAITLILTQSTMQGVSTQPARIERFSQLIDFGPRAAKHDRRRRLLDVEHASEHVHLVRALYHVRHLSHTSGFPITHNFPIDRHDDRVLELTLCNRRNARR